MNNDKKFMTEAIKQAEKARAIGEVPVGAVVVKEGKIIARGYNKRETKKNALCHAEIIAINKACKALGGWRLFGCTLYVTLEPCPMCAGAILNARFDKVVFGCDDFRNGAFGSIFDLNEIFYNHKVQVEKGVFANECSEMLTDFFRQLRNKN